MSVVSRVKFSDYEGSMAKALDLIGAEGRLPQGGLIIIKPNLTNSRGPPVTTSVKAVGAVYNYCRSRSKAEIAIGEGCGDGKTSVIYGTHGYAKLAADNNIRLIDFNEEKSVLLRNKDAFQWKEFYIPEIVKDAFIISVPVLKDHPFTVTTAAMKNMFGIAPAPFYGGTWNKSKLHSPSTHKSVVDVCLYKRPGLCVVDASVALAGSHLSGKRRNLGLILASFDPVAVDAVGSELLGHNPRKIKYLTLADGFLGSIDKIEIIQG
jgi:uncharacterized protein (DUF362 family)